RMSRADSRYNRLSIASNKGPPYRPPFEACDGSNLESLVCPFAVVEHLEGLLQLRINRNVQPLAGRQSRHEPLVVERNEVVVGGKLAERPLHQRMVGIARLRGRGAQQFACSGTQKRK